jgi:tetratricopeptide (TPR) repeat protein
MFPSFLKNSTRYMKRFAWLVSLLAVCATLSAAQQGVVPAGKPVTQNVPAAARGAFDRAITLSKAGKGQLAKVFLEEALKIYPDYFDAHLALGNELFKVGRLTEAMLEFEKARSLNPKDDQVYLSVGLVMMQQKKYDLAASIFADASLLNPREPIHRLMRGIALIRQAAGVNTTFVKNSAAEREALYRQAEQALTEAFDLSGHRLPEVYLYRALIYEKRGERARSADELEQYLQVNAGASNAQEIREAIRKLRDTGSTSQTVPSPQ